MKCLQKVQVPAIAIQIKRERERMYWSTLFSLPPSSSSPPHFLSLHSKPSRTSPLRSGNCTIRGGDANLNLKRCLVDSVYDTHLGLRASPEVRAQVSELINHLEAANPNPNPTQDLALLDGTWVFLYTAFSELLPLLPVGTTSLPKVGRVSQAINTSNSTVEISTTLSTPFATFSFSASATFHVRSPSRIQVQFNEGIFNPPEIKSHVDIPDNLSIFGQMVQQTLSFGPVQEAFSGMTRALSGQLPLKVPIPGEQTSMWMLITYLDEDLRVTRGDGSLFVLAREGSRLLDRYSVVEPVYRPWKSSDGESGIK